MGGLIVPIAILAVTIVAIGSILYGKARGARGFERELLRRGFRPVLDASAAGIDFSVTLQWPESRGVVYLCHFSRKFDHGTLTVANVRCFETTGARMGSLGAKMRTDEIQQTVLGGTVPGIQLPRFCLCPADWATQFQEWSEGGAELETGDSRFDRTFFIVGERDASVGRVLTDPVRAQMLSCPGMMLASGNSSVLLFRQGDVLLPEEVSSYIDVLEAIQQEIAG